MNVANAPCSWGILEFEMEGGSYTYAHVLDEMDSTGFDGTELGDWGFMPTNPQKLKQELEARQLALVGAFVPINFLDPAGQQKGLHIALKTSRLLANVDSQNAKLVLADDNGTNPLRTQNAGRIQREHEMSAEQWKIFTDGVEQVARTIQEETGIPCVFHHHCAGYIETPDEIERLLEKTNPELIGLCFDTGHYKYGGGNVLEGLRKHSNRIEHVHFKDFDPLVYKESQKKKWNYFESVQHGIFCELGKGSINFGFVLDELKKQHYDDWIVVEQDVLPGMGSPKENARQNRDYLKSIGI